MTRSGEAARGVSRRLVLLLAVAAGAAVANLYYAQPLLHTLAGTLGVSGETAGLLVTVTQVGYVSGLAFLVPLGDLLEHRRLIAGTLLVNRRGARHGRGGGELRLFAAALLIAGLSSTVAQVILRMSSTLAAEHERGRVVGTVMSGLLVGILVARTVSGLIAAAFGWRVVFVVAAVGMLALSATIRGALPRVRPPAEMGYGRLLRSVVGLVREEPVLRQRMALGAIGFACLSALWTSLAFLLASPRYGYGNAAIGLFGLAGLAGALCAPVAGRMADHGRGRLAATIALVMLLGSWIPLAVGERSLPALIAGIVALDLGVQALHISNQSTIYGLHAAARSRLTTAYMVAYFFGGAAGSAATSAVYAGGGWGAVCALGGGAAALGLVIWPVSERPGAPVPSLPRLRARRVSTGSSARRG